MNNKLQMIEKERLASDLATGLTEQKDTDVTPDQEPRIVCFIQETVRDKDGNYLACLCQEGVKGFWRTDWRWGLDKAQAKVWADERNATMGLTSQEAMLIQLKTMRK